MKKYVQVLLPIFLVLLLFNCKPKKNIVYLSNNNFETEVSQAKYAGLHIQEGDKLQILVSAFDEIAVRPFNMGTMATTASAGTSSGGGGAAGTDYMVTADGTVILPVLGAVYCKGMTKQQFKADLESRLKRYLTDPMVTITLTNFNFSILGEVGSPGQHTSPSEKLNILQALALSGDIKYEGNKTNVKLIRYSEEEGKDKVVSLDLSEASIINSPYYYLQQNDILYVEPDRNKQVSVNTSSSTENYIRYGGLALGLITLLLTLTRK